MNQNDGSLNEQSFLIASDAPNPRNIVPRPLDPNYQSANKSANKSIDKSIDKSVDKSMDRSGAKSASQDRERSGSPRLNRFFKIQRNKETEILPDKQ